VDIHRRWWVFVVSVVIAILPDFDFLPGLLLGDLRAFHHQASHSLTAVVIVSLLITGLARRWNLNGMAWGIWGGGLYLSHIILDLLVNDPSSPFGVQLLWPFSESYFISPVTPFASFDYFDQTAGMISAMLSVHNFQTMVREILLMAPLVGLTWYVRKYCTGGNLEK